MSIEWALNEHWMSIEWALDEHWMSIEWALNSQLTLGAIQLQFVVTLEPIHALHAAHTLKRCAVLHTTTHTHTHMHTHTMYTHTHTHTHIHTQTHTQTHVILSFQMWCLQSSSYRLSLDTLSGLHSCESNLGQLLHVRARPFISLHTNAHKHTHWYFKQSPF